MEDCYDLRTHSVLGYYSRWDGDSELGNACDTRDMPNYDNQDMPKDGFP